MAEKLDLFELSIKRGLENAVEPFNEADWDVMEKRLDGLYHVSSSSAGFGFLANFGLAAAALAGLALIFSFPAKDSHELHADHNPTHQEIIHSPENENIRTDIAIGMEAGDSSFDEGINGFDSESKEGDFQATDGISESEKNLNASNLGKAEKDRMIRINEKLKKAAENEKAKDSIDKRFTTRYVGKDFDLGAARTFSPNNDGVRDNFMPNTLRDGDTFIMTISNEAGKIIYRTKDVKKPWEGVDVSGKVMPAGHYSWEVILQKDNKKEIFKGIVKLEL